MEAPRLTTVDVEAGLAFAGHFHLAVGARNLFDTYPEQWTLSDGLTGRTPGFLGAIYPLNHPAGFNGGSNDIGVSTNF